MVFSLSPGREGPIAPSVESKIVLAVRAAIALLLGLAWTYLDRPSTYICTQGGKGTVGCRAVGEVDETVAWVSRSDGVDRDVDIFKVAEAIGGKNFLDIARFG